LQPLFTRSGEMLAMSARLYSILKCMSIQRIRKQPNYRICEAKSKPKYSFKLCFW